MEHSRSTWELKHHKVLHTGFFLWGGGGGAHISAASRGLVACSPRKFLYSTLDSDLILGGGGELKLEGGNPSAPPPLPLYATLSQHMES